MASGARRQSDVPERLSLWYGYKSTLMVFRHQRVSEDGLACIERDTHTQPYVHRLHGRDAEEKLYGEEGVQSYCATGE